MKSRIGKLSLLAVMIFSVFSFSSNQYTSAMEPLLKSAEGENCVFNLPKDELQISEKLVSKVGHDVYEVKGDPDRYVEELGLVRPSPDAKLVGLAFSHDSSAATDSTMFSDDYSTLATGDKYAKKTSSGEVCLLNVLRSSYYPAGNAKMIVSEKVAATVSANAEISAVALSASLGYSVTNEFLVSDEYSTVVPAGKTLNISAYPINIATTFDIYQERFLISDKLIGSGTAYRPVGVCFQAWEI